MQDDEEEIIHIKPQPGFQEKVALSKADITIIGGAAGCGKSFIMLYIPLMYTEADKNLRVVYFRETQSQIREAGALWDESTKLYPLRGGEASESILKWRFPSGATIDFNGIQYEKDLLNFQGAAIPLILFDELTQFTKKKFIFMISRNRGRISIGKFGCLQKPQVFASCNPDPDSWVAQLVEWYIDQETGYPIPEREGKLRYFIVIKDKFVWGNTKKEIWEKNPDFFNDEAFVKSGMHPSNLIKSFTFIGGKIYDNKILTSTNPGYLGSLMAQSEADQERFLRGNWKIRADDTGLYKAKLIDNIFIDTKLDQDSQYIVGWNKGQPTVGYDRDYKNNYITCDAAKFGRDLCVIMVWRKFTVIHTTIFYHSSPQDIYNEIELLRKDNYVLRKNTLIDQDGVGGDVVKLGGYYGFIARRIPGIDETTGEKENYDKRKDQCYYRSASRLNDGGIKYIALQSTVKIYDRGARKPRWSTMLDWNNDKIDIKVLIKKQLSAIKRGTNVDIQGGNIKLTVNSKEEQKEILGHSPDFADNFMMREDFEISRIRKDEFRTY